MNSDSLKTWSQPAEPSLPPVLMPPLLVFHINDSTDDQVLFQAACKKAQVPIQWHVAVSASGGISYFESLLTLSRTQAVHWPDLLLLDVVMPGGTGLEVLEYIRAEPKLQALPVVIFTGHPSVQTREEAFRLGANSFHEKPHNFDEIVVFVKALYQTWSAARRLPT